MQRPRPLASASRIASFHRISAQDRTVPGLPVDAVRLLRRSDPGGSWSFLRCDDGEDRHLGLWSRTTAAARSGFTAALRRDALRHGWSLRSGTHGPLPVVFPGRDGTALAEEVFTASSGFALDLAARAPEDRDLMPVALAHLRRSAELVAPPDRAAFLFLHGRAALRGLTPAQRVEVTARALAESDPRAWPRPEQVLRADLAHHWERYLALLARNVVDRRPPGCAPVPLLLFQHVRLTHNRIGVAAAVAAAAAFMLRAAVVADSSLLGPGVTPGAAGGGERG